MADLDSPLLFCRRVIPDSTHHSYHTSTRRASWRMENEPNSKRTADGFTVETKRRKKISWLCKTNGCPKQAQTGRLGHCKKCYNNLVLNRTNRDGLDRVECGGVASSSNGCEVDDDINAGRATEDESGAAALAIDNATGGIGSIGTRRLNLPRSDLTDGAENLASLSDHGSNNALDCGGVALSYNGCEVADDINAGRATDEDESGSAALAIDNATGGIGSIGTRRLNLPQSDLTEGAENLASFSDRGCNNATVSLQHGATSYGRCVSIPSMAYVATLENRIHDLENVNKNLERRILYLEPLENRMHDMEKINEILGRRLLELEQLMRDGASPFLSSHSFSSGQHNSVDIPTGLSYFSSSSKASTNNPPRIRTSRTHQDMLTRCHTNQSNMTPHAGLRNTGVICYANAIFQALASFHHLTTLFDEPPPYDSGTFPLNHAFCTVLHSMVMSPINQESEVDPGTFVDLFTDRHKNFQHEESKFSYDIVLPYHQIHFAHDIF